MKGTRLLPLAIICLTLILVALPVMSGCASVDKPYYSEDELTAIVRSRLLQYKAGEHRVISASVSNVNYVGDHKWSGTCRIKTTAPSLPSFQEELEMIIRGESPSTSKQWWDGTWTYYEKSGTLETNFR